jgi:hypothetical protein
MPVTVILVRLRDELRFSFCDMDATMGENWVCFAANDTGGLKMGRYGTNNPLRMWCLFYLEVVNMTSQKVGLAISMIDMLYARNTICYTEYIEG